MLFERLLFLNFAQVCLFALNDAYAGTRWVKACINGKCLLPYFNRLVHIFTCYILIFLNTALCIVDETLAIQIVNLLLLLCTASVSKKHLCAQTNVVHRICGRGEVEGVVHVHLDTFHREFTS